MSESFVIVGLRFGTRPSGCYQPEPRRSDRRGRAVLSAHPTIRSEAARSKAKVAIMVLLSEPTILLTQAQNKAPVEFAFSYAIDANRSLTITLHEVYLALAKTPIEEPAGVEASFVFREAFNVTAAQMMTAVLRNQQAGTKYA
ncbi:hypothetical protein [Neoroseomonas lacus]|uniref:Uncharacterized protein n=1 Tax=Neoroseomonas lacus TaxID=287609 RepID=A0A917L364_9PROT|nr:hypothetical protein [Neoroseomonas lacus]GGJ42504.1 hypothetical protein GCM10011320_57700 [Neoroseomonas lacus]